MSEQTTRAPSRAKPMAIARPMPELAPVTIATLLSSRPIVFSPMWQKVGDAHPTQDSALRTQDFLKDCQRIYRRRRAAHEDERGHDQQECPARARGTRLGE